VLTRNDPYPGISLEQFSNRVTKENLSTTALDYVPSDSPTILREIAISCLQIDPTKRPLFGTIYDQLAEFQLKDEF